MPNSSGTWVFRLDGASWTPTQLISTNNSVNVDVKSVGAGSVCSSPSFRKPDSKFSVNTAWNWGGRSCGTNSFQADAHGKKGGAKF